MATQQASGLWLARPDLVAKHQLANEVPETVAKALEAKAADSGKRVRRPPARHAAFFEDTTAAPQPQTIEARQEAPTLHCSTIDQ